MSAKKKESGFDFSKFDEHLQEQIKTKGIGSFVTGGQDFVNELVSRTYQALLDAELEEHLELENSDPQTSNNTRNGKGKKTIRGDFGQAQIETPRDRNATFEPQIVKKRSSTVGNFTDKIISLYARGMTTSEISAHLQEMYGIELSESFVSRAVSTVQEQVQQWQDRPLSELYAILYVDGIRFNVRGDNGKIIKKCIYTVLGITPGGQQEVLGLWISDTEGASFWLSVLKDLQTRGVNDVLITCVDGLVGMPEAIESIFPKTHVQLCIVHQIRSCTKFISYKDRKALCADMKLIYEAPNEQSAKSALKKLDEKWGKQYPAVIASWKNKWSLLVNFLNYPKELRRITYTTNAVEALHSLFRKNTKNRRVFPNDESLIRLLYLNIQNLTNKWTRRAGWNTVANQLSIIFGDRVNKFLLDNMEY